MTAIRLNGKQGSERLLQVLRGRVVRLTRTPKLATILVGQRYDSEVYVRLKVAAAKKVGIRTIQYHLPQRTSQRRLEWLIDQLNKQRSVTGILLQLPLPAPLNADRAVAAIDPRKDVDGFHPGNRWVTPPPVAAVLKLISMAHPKRRAEAVILGRDSVLTRMVKARLSGRGHSVDVVPVKHRIPPVAKRADIIVTVLGRGPRLLARQVKRNVIIIDVGIRHQGGKTIGDVDRSVWSKAKAVTPVPGGVGPLTVAYVLMNTYRLAERRS